MEKLTGEQPNIEALYVFGSRAYQTRSTRSDFDILVKVSDGKNVKSGELREFARSECPALDLFIVNGGRATSCANDSYVYGDTFEELAARLEAIQIWSIDKKFFDIKIPWTFETSAFMNFVQTSLPDGYIDDLSWQTLLKRVEQQGLPVRPYIGDSIDGATALLIDVARRMVMQPRDLAQRGAAKSGWTVNLQSEYDCQNLFYTTVKPWLPSLAREETTIYFDGQNKIADFTLFEGQLVIEMKFIDTDDKKREVVKTLDGLTRFYSRSANIKRLLMLVYFKSGLNLDAVKWEADYTRLSALPGVSTHLIAVP
jgi:REase_DpnII-MboI/Polymerase beta, Nucleotidyltransferase